jgi:hypothetical protein
MHWTSLRHEQMARPCFDGVNKESSTRYADTQWSYRACKPSLIKCQHKNVSVSGITEPSCYVWSYNSKRCLKVNFVKNVKIHTWNTIMIMRPDSRIWFSRLRIIVTIHLTFEWLLYVRLSLKLKKNLTFCPRSVLTCFQRISQQTAINFLCIIKGDWCTQPNSNVFTAQYEVSH